MEQEPKLSPEELGIEDKEIAEKEKPIDALVVFGGGIISDKVLDGMDMGKTLIGQPEKGWRLPLGAKLRTIAAANLYFEGQVQDVIFTGGSVKKEEGIETSEARLMKDYLHHKLENWWTRDLKKEGKNDDEIRAEIESRWQNTEPHILLEDKATNTIENFAHTINYLESNKQECQNIAFLSNNFHIDRITQLANKFGVQGESFGAESIVSQVDQRYEKIANNYFDPETNETYRSEIIGALEGEEKRIKEWRLGFPVKDLIKDEKRWSRGLDEIPEYWLPNVKFIQNPDQLKNILKAEQNVQEVLRQHGIENIDAATEAEIREVLEGIERKMPPEEWGEE